MTSMMWGFDADITLTQASMARAFPYFAIVVSYGNVALLYEAPHYKTMTLLTFAPAMDTLIR